MSTFVSNFSGKQVAILLICLMAMILPSSLRGQYAYGISWRGPGNVGSPFIGLFDLDDCNMCLIKDLVFFPQDLLSLPNGDVMLLLASQNANPRYSFFETYNFPDTTPVSTSPNLMDRWFRSILLFNGQYYMTYLDSLYTVDLNTFQVTPVPGAIPLPAPPGAGTIIFRLFEYNGGLYGVYSPNGSGSTFIVQLDPSDASASTLYGTVNGLTNYLFVDVSILGGQYHISGAGLPPYTRGVFVFEMAPPTATSFVCGATFPSNPPYPSLPFPIAPYGMVDAPASHPFFPCICANKAGEIFISPSNRCIGNNQMTVNVLIPGVPANGDIIRYLVVTDTNDLSGSLIVSSSSPTITVPPALIGPNVPYFVVMAVGENVSGSVNLADPCLKLSNFQVVIWRPIPSVALSIANPDVCAGDCTEVTAVFTGTPPFTLTYTAPGLGPVTQTFPGNTGTFQVCVPANAPLGGFSVAATSLTDGFCSCQ